jgi:hypothetical protein
MGTGRSANPPILHMPQPLARGLIFLLLEVAFALDLMLA